MDLTIGDTRITRIEESCAPGFRPGVLFPDWHVEALERHRGWLVPGHYNADLQRLVLSVHAWLIRLNGRVVLVDTCGGDDKERPDFPGFNRKRTGFLDRLAAAGVTPEMVDTVFLTHLHIDHVGWNTRLIDGRWVPTFPNARYVMPRADREHFGPQGAGGRNEANARWFADSVQPVIDAGLADTVGDGHVIAPGLVIEAASGHSPGHSTLRLEAGGRDVLFTGDLMHHPLQVFEPDWSSAFCFDADEARRSRRRVLADCVRRGTLVCPGHFAAPHAGRIEARGGSFAFVA